MKNILLILSLITTFSTYANETDSESLIEKVSRYQWHHGAENCDADKSAAIEVLAVNKDTYILRQNRCTNFEAPFIYLLFGEHTLFIQDTGATGDANVFPLYQTVKQIIKQRAEEHKDKRANELKILVTHSHGHSDHRAADAQFRGKENVTLIEPEEEAMQGYFGFNQWPEGEATIDLGNRKLTVFPIPGHHARSIAVYDPDTQWLLTGDTFYPGRLYVMDWKAFKYSISKLVSFSKTHTISALMGTHIEMSNQAGIDYPMGNSFQPNEAPLPLSVVELRLLDETLVEMGDEVSDKVLDKFIISPVGILQKTLSTVLGWFLG